MSPISRRDFLKVAGGATVGVAALGQAGMALLHLAVVTYQQALVVLGMLLLADGVAIGGPPEGQTVVPSSSRLRRAT